MAFDYSEIQAVALELIEEFGRDITLVKMDRAAGDSSKPWKGPADPDANRETLPLKGVFVPPNTVRQFGLTALGEGTEFRDMLDFSEQIIITAQGDNDLRGYDRVQDSGYTNQEWAVIGYQVLRPGDTYLLGFIGVRR